MEALHQDDFQTAVNLLHRANYMLRQHSSSLEVIRLKAITLNNLGCLYKRSNQYSKSLQFLKEALECEKKLPSDYTNIAGTHLNLSAIKSLMSNHEDSLSHALKAINIIQQNPELDQELIRSLVVAYYNAGTEYQLLNRNGEASTFLRHGFNLAYKYLGHDHPLTLSFGLKKSNRSKPKIIDYELINRSLDLSNSNKKFLPDLQNKSRAQTIKNDGIELDTTPWEDQNKGNLRGIFRSDGKNKNNEITTPRKKFGKAINDHKSMSPRVTDNKTSTRAEFTKQMKSETEKSPFKLSPSIDHNQKNLLNKSDTQQSPKNSILTPRKTEPLKLPVKLSPMNEKPQIKSNNKILKEKLIPQKIQKKTVDSPKISYDSPSPTVKTKDSSSNLYNVSTKGSTYSSVAPPKTKEISNSPLQMMSTLDSSSSPMPNSMVKNKSNGPMTPLLDTPVQPRKSVSPLSSEVKTRLTSIDDKLSVLQNRLNIFENKIQPLKELTETEEDDLSSITSPDLQISSKRTQAATKIQSKYRGYKTRQKYLQFLRCVLKIQKNIKGWLGRIQYRYLKQEAKGQRDFGQQYRYKNAPKNTEIQTDLRMNDPILKFVSQAPSKRLIDQSLLQIVTLIQAQIRSFLQRKRYAKRKRSLLMIQKFARQYKTKRLFKKIVHSVTFIQAMYRGYLARKAAKREADLIEKAVYKSVKVW